MRTKNIVSEDLLLELRLVDVPLSEKISYFVKMIPPHYLGEVDQSADPSVVYGQLVDIYCHLKNTYSRV